MAEIAAGPFEAFDWDAAAEVVADRADVLGAQPEAGAGDEGTGDLAAGAEVFCLEGHLAGVGREVRNDEQGIRGIEAHSNDVEFRHGRDYCKRGWSGLLRRFTDCRPTPMPERPASEESEYRVSVVGRRD